jgi:F-type H+-transporting ATPase subunit delta
VSGGGLSRRYAKALADVAAERGALESISRDLEAVGGILRDHRDAAAFFSNPAIPLGDKRRVLETLADRASVSPLAATFLALLLEKRRILSLPQIARAYRDLVDERLNRAKATVTAAAPLPEPVLDRLKARLGQATGKEIYLEAAIDPAILGGVVAQVGSTVYDGSLRTQLRRMREYLLKG